MLGNIIQEIVPVLTKYNIQVPLRSLLSNKPKYRVTNYVNSNIVTVVSIPKSAFIFVHEKMRIERVTINKNTGQKSWCISSDKFGEKFGGKCNI